MRDVDLTVGADTSFAAAGLADLKNQAGRAMGDLQSIFAKSFTVGGIIAAGKAVVEYASHVQDLSDRYAVSTKILQEWGNVAEQQGGTIDTIGKAFNRLEISVSKAIGGNKGIVESFDRLGISVEDLEKLQPDEIAEKIAHSSMDAADMVKIFGKNALELVPIFSAVADGTIPLGKAIDDRIIKKLDAADDRLKRFTQSARVAFAEILEGFLDANDALFSKEAWTPGGMDRKRAGETIKKMGDIPAANQGRQALGGAATSEDFDMPGAGGGGGGAGGAASLRERIGRIEQEQAARQRSDAEQLNVLLEKRKGLTNDMLRATGHMGEEAADEKTQQEAILKVAEVNSEIDKVRENLVQDQAAAEKEVRKQRELAAAEAEKELQAAQQELETAQTRARLASLVAKYGDELGTALEKQLELEEQIAKLAYDISDAYRDGNEELGDTLTDLQKQLQIEKNITAEQIRRQTGFDKWKKDNADLLKATAGGLQQGGTGRYSFGELAQLTGRSDAADIYRREIIGALSGRDTLGFALRGSLMSAFTQQQGALSAQFPAYFQKLMEQNIALLDKIVTNTTALPGGH